MNTILKQVALITQIDQLIRLQATGTPEAFAYRLGISKTKLYRVLKTMKLLKASILYDMTLQSFVYETVVEFQYGFYDLEIGKVNRLSLKK
ncbi:hypothetical protein [Aquimarina aggregata]|uniref:hypothetical protein n=1 Tax=Aquimarina aggregata TaxID=1642818 RepID=UPI0024908049|nr:hypothetical protein [Aquimarina aggregata]